MNKKYKIKKMKGITLISLVITIVVLIILASIGIYLSLGNNGIFTRSKEAKENTNKQTATEIINLKIITAQMNKYSEKQVMPTLKELSEVLRDDNEIQYVTEKSQIASTKYEVGENPSSIYTKLNEYPYEFEINSSLQLASINGVKLIANNTIESPYNYSLEEKIIGKWIDGKDLYQKTVTCGEIIEGGKDIPHNIKNIDNIIYINGITKDNINGNFRPIPLANNGDNVIFLQADKTNIRIWTTKVMLPSINTYITLQYTKN